jgi:hypothetical protein
VTTTLYRLYADNGELLYVGLSMYPPARFKRHEAERPWWSAVASIRLEPFSDPVAAAEAEREAIRLEFPLHNVNGSPTERQKRQPIMDPEGTDPVAAMLREVADPVRRELMCRYAIEAARRVRKEAIQELYRSLGTWEKVGEAVGLPRQDAWRVARG